MGYYIRVLSPSGRIPAVSALKAALAHDSLAGVLTTEAGPDDVWAQLLLAHDKGPEIAVIERSEVSSDGLGSEEIDEFLEDIQSCKPVTAVAWLADYLPRIKTIYAFQVLRGTEVKSGWEILGKLKSAIHSQVGGILQADGEGFSNEDGYHILWQFSASAKGTWWMGVLQGDEWIHFQMDLGNKKHRKAFFQGEVPEGVKIAEQF